MSSNIKNVIVVDDQVLVRAGIQALLGTLPEFNCRAAVSCGQEALAACEAHAPDIILVDLIMPGMDGVVLAELLQQRHPDVKVLVLSSSTEPKLVRQLMGLGVRGYVSKDFVLDELMLALRNPLNNQKKPEAVSKPAALAEAPAPVAVVAPVPANPVVRRSGGTGVGVTIIRGTEVEATKVQL